MEYQGNAPGSREAFRLLRAQLQELCGVCIALADATDLDNLWRRIVKNAQLQLNVDGCTYYSMEGDHLRFRVVLSRSLGIISGIDGTEVADFPRIPLYREDGEANTDSVAARVALEGVPVNMPRLRLSTTRNRRWSPSIE